MEKGETEVLSFFFQNSHCFVLYFYRSKRTANFTKKMEVVPFSCWIHENVSYLYTLNFFTKKKNNDTIFTLLLFFTNPFFLFFSRFLFFFLTKSIKNDMMHLCIHYVFIICCIQILKNIPI